MQPQHCKRCSGRGYFQEMVERWNCPDCNGTGKVGLFVYDDLRTANVHRQEVWGPGISVDSSFRAMELGGEAGEALNVVKKLERERLGIPGSRATVDDLADELADVIICCDLLALRYGINLDKAVARKFNKTSRKMGLPVEMMEG